MKHKNNFWSPLAMVVIAICTSFVSCSNDDDDGNGGISGSMSKSVGVIDKETGMRVSTAAGYYNYVYNDNGTLKYIASGSNCRYEFSGNKVVHVDDGDYDDAETTYVGYNSNGYVSTFKSNNSGKRVTGKNGVSPLPPLFRMTAVVI